MARVLIVDSSEDVRSLYRTVLVSAGHEVLEAGSAHGARMAAIHGAPDLVLSELCIREPADGEGIIQFLKDAMPHVPVVIIAGAFSDTGDEREAAQRLGVSAFLRKQGGCFRVLDIVRALAGADPVA